MGVLVKVEKCWQTVLGTEVSCSQWEGSTCTQSAFFFLLSFGARGGWGVERRIFFFFPLFPTGSQCVSQGLFPIAPCFNPLCFAQSPPLLTYICRPKGRPSIFLLDVLFWWASIVSTFLFVMGQWNSTKKSCTCEG